MYIALYSVTHCGIYITRTLYKTDHNKQLKVMALNDHSETTTKSTYSQDELPELLPLYYRRLFPYNQYYRWLNYGGLPKTYFQNREFSFTLKDDIYIRYQSFADQSEMEKEIQKRCPYKIDIGAVFTHRPKDHRTVKAASFQAQEKELVFDIDMTDYDDVRVCCQGADICEKCWPLMRIAVRIVDRALHDDFGFDHRMWVYSGRRGVHCWVADEAARKLSQNARSAIAEYLSVVKGGENQVKKVSLPEHLHPSIEQAKRIINHYFEGYALRNQGLMEDKASWEKVLTLVNDSNLRKLLAEQMERAKTSAERWDRLERCIMGEVSKGNVKKCQHLVTEIKFQYCYPRLDVNVSKGINHLLKSPFCVHPKTGRVCVAFDAKDVDNFDPFTVPDISQLCREIDEFDRKQKATNDENEPPSKKRIKDYKKTSLLKSIQVFEQFVTGLEGTRKGKLIEQSDIKKEF
ncbi:DNA primase small subunit-like isoform X2 [Asterias rubens]|uniref:DNA primase small subunit-like isoform X2 n=1 Tax=Asterias rubens TaxID=7604 RepID=UPI00145570A0|nr:DNA primase small subunit-like isoform X2 [Asterias rubens]